jgi:hypothetical protein
VLKSSSELLTAGIHWLSIGVAKRYSIREVHDEGLTRMRDFEVCMYVRSPCAKRRAGPYPDTALTWQLPEGGFGMSLPSQEEHALKLPFIKMGLD